ncbi:unnamed protein product [Sphagnum jensenii]|uniref:Uncharacterized protein n=2 Tax=Sphagnum jensenii TaxID=128206 RepID=A0ABP0VFD8_9BRYO
MTAPAHRTAKVLPRSSSNGEDLLIAFNGKELPSSRNGNCSALGTAIAFHRQPRRRPKEKGRRRGGLKLAEVAVIIVVGSGFVRKRFQDALAACCCCCTICLSVVHGF